MRRCGRALPGLVVLVASLLACGAPASATTTLGSTLEHSYDATFGGSGQTVYQEVAPSETLVAPSAGTITKWSVRSGDKGAEYELRVLRPAAGGEFTAAGTSAAYTVPDAEDKMRGPFAVNLPVKAGDRIALDVIGGLGAPIANVLAPAADELNYLSDPFADGATKAPVLESGLGGSQELLLQAIFSAGPPANLTLPVISGEPRVGVLLTTTEGTWENGRFCSFRG
jgi:hypothetical protein